MQWTSRTEQQAADLINRAHTQQYRVNDFQPQYNAGLRQVPRYRAHQPVPYFSAPQGPAEYQPIRPRDVLLYGSWIAMIFGFLGGAAFAVMT